MMKRYTNYKKFEKHNGLTYPIGSDFICENGQLLNSEGFMCMVDSQKSHECMVGNDDGEGANRGKLIKAINKYLYNPINEEHKEDQLNALWTDNRALLYSKHLTPENGAWLWTGEFFCAPIDDLKYIKKLLEHVKKSKDYTNNGEGDE